MITIKYLETSRLREVQEKFKVGEIRMADHNLQSW